MLTLASSVWNTIYDVSSYEEKWMTIRLLKKCGNGVLTFSWLLAGIISFRSVGETWHPRTGFTLLCYRTTAAVLHSY